MDWWDLQTDDRRHQNVMDKVRAATSKRGIFGDCFVSPKARKLPTPRQPSHFTDREDQVIHMNEVRHGTARQIQRFVDWYQTYPRDDC